ncbi:MAG: DUF1292 domain-containing protein [Lachnospiraceae bacterium]|nr:DUF1292 domain-containing protein [Lachnospiraceae bacterium]
MNKKYDTPDEEMTVSITLDDDTEILCDVITILTVEGKDYIAVLPRDTSGRFEEDEVWIYGYRENPEDPNEEPELIYIDDEEEYERVGDAFDEYLDELEFDDED